MTTVRAVRPASGGGYLLDLSRTDRGTRVRKTLSSDQVVISAGALGTQKLLQMMKVDGHLPALSERLGWQFRTNSEALMAVVRSPLADGPDHTRGVAITSSFFPDDRTHIEPVRFSQGSNLIALLGTLLVDGDLPGEPQRARALRYLDELKRNPTAQLKISYVRKTFERGFILLVMQDVDNSLQVTLKRSPFPRLSTSHGEGERPPTWIPVAHDVARNLAERMGGQAFGTWLEIADIPITAHILGGSVIGESADRGVIDPYHRVYGYPGLHVTDGSAISANLGVNPSLTITAQAERAMSFWPNKGQDDPRPVVGADYKRVAPIEPKSPVVPADAPGALRLPVG